MKTFILRDRAEFNDLHGNTTNIYVLRFKKDRTAHELQDEIDYYSSLYSDYDYLYQEDKNELSKDRIEEIEKELEELKNCCQLSYVMNKLSTLYKDMKVDAVYSNDMSLWF